MWIWFFSLFLVAQQESVSLVVPSTEIYNRLTKRNTVRLPTGSFLVLDSFENRVVLFQPGSGKPKVVATKGPGPGEIENANHLFRFKDEVYIFSASHFQSFDFEGRFLRKVRISPGHNLLKTASGWLVGRWDRKVSRTGLFLADEKLRESKSLVHWLDRLKGPQILEPGKTNVIEMFQDIGGYVVSMDGARVFYRQPNRPTIHIYDLKKEVLVGTIHFESRYLFSKLVGEEAEETLQEGSSQSKIKGKFPKYYPYTSGMYFNKENHLIIRRLKGVSEQLLRFDRDGNPLPPPQLNLEQMKRVIAIEDDMFYISFQNPTEGDMGISRVPRAQAKTYIETHPID